MGNCKKPDFSQIIYSPDLIAVPIGGNKLGYTPIIGKVITDPTGYNELQQQDYLKAKSIYDENINVGARFYGIQRNGKKNTDTIAVITYISEKTQCVTWEFFNQDEIRKKNQYVVFKKVKWNINAMISMVKQNFIEFTDEQK